mmetsp:Transcript_14919/g.28089  ORF Transcript_14919/g.28089 Transcript_14919/m.28089 type:complete len:192 (+) Transcript_14919:346-921(+)
MTLKDYNTNDTSNGNPPPTAPGVVVAQPAAAAGAIDPEINVYSSTTNYGYKKQDQYDYAYTAEAQIVNDAPGVPAISAQVMFVSPVNPAASNNNNNTSNPPGNCPDGGQWGVMEYVGNKTTALACLGCLCFGLFGLCFLACPQDEQDAYCVNGKLYDAGGTLIGPVSRYKFTPTREGRKVEGGAGGVPRTR